LAEAESNFLPRFKSAIGCALIAQPSWKQRAAPSLPQPEMTIMPSLRARRPKTPFSAFQPVPLVSVLMSLLGWRKRKLRAKTDPDWERDEPMTGLS
jgi:hypothetical protein